MQIVLDFESTDILISLILLTAGVIILSIIFPLLIKFLEKRRNNNV